MIEIKFRGKDKDKNWVYGDLIHGVGASDGDIFILPIAINLAYIPNCDPIDGVCIDKNISVNSQDYMTRTERKYTKVTLLLNTVNPLYANG